MAVPASSLTRSLQRKITQYSKCSPRDPQIADFAEDLLNTSEEIIKKAQLHEIKTSLWHRFLSVTAKNNFLISLESDQKRHRWTEAVFEIIRHSGYHLRHVFEQRVREHPRKILFREFNGKTSSQWSYEQIFRYAREIATVFYQITEDQPRVAIWSENSVDSASCDLACLCFDILDTPVSIHFDECTIEKIFNELDINIVVTDSWDRLRKLLKIQARSKSPFQIMSTDSNLALTQNNVRFLGEACKCLHISDIQDTLKKREKKPLNRIATVMYTSGSTGEAKGVCFSIYNLVTKRFARAAALPQVGSNEILLCYLPLFHTFGRFLELLGTVFWGGTYVFPGNTSSETLINLFPLINPTGFISIPLRWEQLKEKCIQKMEGIPDAHIQAITLREVIGNRLRWGLSAAGYLDSQTFKFFQRYGIDLCSGFGMTEATGGITMTPPGRYIANTHGLPLPGIRVRLTKMNEMQISGAYVGRYYEEAYPQGFIDYPESEAQDYWLSTGDIFRVSREHYYEIIDRIKDIYKNNKGQTIAPRKVEKKFTNVPGIKNTFLVGDGKPYNVLFIVPDPADPVMIPLKSKDQIREYFHQLVAAANKDLAPFERIINFAILERDFSPDNRELTPKGSFNRKIILDHFSHTIEDLYRLDYVDLELGGLIIRIPRWFYRDLTILEDDIITTHQRLKNIETGEQLLIHRLPDSNAVQIGNLEYHLDDNMIDLGRFARQPLLWMGNPELIAFCPVREGWDVPLQNVSPHIFLPWKKRLVLLNEEDTQAHRIRNPRLAKLHGLFAMMLFAPVDKARQAVENVGTMLKRADAKTAELIRHRFEALARHEDERIRCNTYRILLLNESEPDFGQTFPAFINSGLSFLNQETIETIAFTKLEQHRLEALRQRLFMYRLQLDWPVSKAMRQQFEHIFQLLVSFVGYHTEFYNTVRAELASWVLHKSDLELAKSAEKYFTRLFKNFEARLERETPPYSHKEWDQRIVYEDGLSRNEISRIHKVLVNSTFLKQSILLAFDQVDFDLKDIPADGIWISRIQSSHYHLLYRMSINTIEGKHFDLQLVLRETQPTDTIAEAVHWLEAVAGYPFGSPVLPRLGCYRPELGARSMIFMNEINVWGKIRQFSSVHFTGGPFPQRERWRKIFVEAMAAFYKGWRNSGSRIVTGTIFPHNVVVPELDFREGATILSLIGWYEYVNTLSLVKPMLQNFYQKTVAHYPWCKGQLEITWIFDACIEALGLESAMEFLDQLRTDLKNEPLHDSEGNPLRKILIEYLLTIRNHYYKPLALRNAIERYYNWEKTHPLNTPGPREQTVIELYQLYRLDKYPEIVRYFYYRDTYFSHSGPDIRAAFDRLLSVMIQDPDRPAIELLELSDLQAVLDLKIDRDVFSRMVFPRFHHRKKLDVIKVGESEQEQVIVHSSFNDNYGVSYTVRAPVSPSEIGQLYRLFFNEKYPKTISEQDQHFVVLDAQDRIVGGLCYQIPEDRIAQIEGTVVSGPLKDRGIHTAMIEDFCNRMASNGIQMIKAPLVMQPFYAENGFRVDKRWGSLIKFLAPEEQVEQDKFKISFHSSRNEDIGSLEK